MVALVFVPGSAASRVVGPFLSCKEAEEWIKKHCPSFEPLSEAYWGITRGRYAGERIHILELETP